MVTNKQLKGYMEQLSRFNFSLVEMKLIEPEQYVKASKREACFGLRCSRCVNQYDCK